MTRRYKTRPNLAIVAVNPDGSVHAVYNGASDASRIFNMHKSSFNRYCRRNMIAMGKKWFYERQFREIYMNCELEKLRFDLPDDYHPGDRYFCVGHKHGNGWHRRSEESKQRHTEFARQRMIEMNAKGINRTGVHAHYKPVVCLEDGLEFPSIRHAADHYGVRPNHVSQAVHKLRTVRGKRIRLKSQLERIKEVI